MIAYNDAHVMAAWGKANNVKGDDILFLSDTGNKFSESIGWTNGPRLARYALVIDKGIVTYAAKDNKGEVDVSPHFTSISALFKSPNARGKRKKKVDGTFPQHLGHQVFCFFLFSFFYPSPLTNVHLHGKKTGLCR